MVSVAGRTILWAVGILALFADTASAFTRPSLSRAAGSFAVHGVKRGSIVPMHTFGVSNLETKADFSALKMALTDPEESAKPETKLPMLLDVGTKGGALFLSLVLFLVPIIFYQVITLGFGVDGIEAGKWIGVGFTVVTCILWAGSYVFRVATKDMTYAKQLKDYENAVIAKRLEELDEDEVQALVEDIERDDF
mmetsp:Transcript_25134/g.45497  ORF Transcript_25134/g.45497 Transcript_25134/m.45497 type:complete len:194 (-) Transcript_25134:2264-2845(-)